MPNKAAILWFKHEFGPRITTAIAGTPLSIDMLTAIACQETGDIWPALHQKGLPTARILELCVGDTLDENKGRHAFPKTKADLLSKPNGAAMFAIARQALLDMAEQIPAYKAVAQHDPNKFCHAFGIFQYDLQFFLHDPQYFLQKKYADFDLCLGRCVGELKRCLAKLGLATRASITDIEMAHVAICYNTGGYDPAKGLKQGHSDGVKFYGEAFLDLLHQCIAAGPSA